MDNARMSFKAVLSEWMLKHSKEYSKEKLAEMLDYIFEREGLVIKESGRLYTDNPQLSLSENYKAFERVVNVLQDRNWFERYYGIKTFSGICINRNLIYGDEAVVYPYFHAATVRNGFDYSSVYYGRYEATVRVEWKEDADKMKLMKVKDNFTMTMLDAGFQVYEGVEDEAPYTVYCEPCIDVDRYLCDHSELVESGEYLDMPSNEQKERWTNAFIETFRDKGKEIAKGFIENDEFLDCITALECYDSSRERLDNAIMFADKESWGTILKAHPHLKEGLSDEELEEIKYYQYINKG